MKRHLCALLGVMLGAVWACSGQVKEVLEMMQPNVVSNGGFEADTDGMPDGWELDVDSDDFLFTGKLSTQSHSGRYSFCVEKGMGRRGTDLRSPHFDLKQDVAYEVSVWLRMDSRFPKDTIRMQVRANTHSELFDLSMGRSWRKSTVIFRTESGTTSGRIQFDQLGGLAERLYIDDVEVREIEAEDDRPPIQKTDLSDFVFPEHRPRLEHTSEEIEEIKRSMQGRDIHEHAWVENADPWLKKQLHFFEEGYDFKKYWTIGRHCPVDAKLLEPIIHPDGTTEMKCPVCDRIYRNEEHRACARAMYNEQMARGAGWLGKAYTLTGDVRYARRAAEILVGFAGRYKQWGGGGHAVLYMLRESNGFLIPCTTAYDYIYDSGVLSAEDRRKIEEDFFRVAGEYYSNHADTNGRMNNRGAIHNRNVMAIGSAINDRGFVDQALNSPHSGFHTLAARIFDPDGLAWEGFGYHTYTLVGLSPIAEMAYRIGINVYGDPAYRKVFEAPLQVFLPGEVDPESRHSLLDVYEIACRRFAELGKAIEFPFDKEDRVKVIPSSSFNFKHFGYGVLRSGEGEDQIYLSMSYGKEAMFMGHAPALKFGLVLYANRQLLTPRGMPSGYGHPLTGGWSRNPLAHNSITADDTDQWGRTEGKLIAFEAAPRVKLMRAVDNGAYGDIALDRTLFLTDGYVVDLSGAYAESGRHRYDLCYRSFGELSCPLPFEGREEPLGVGYGYQYLTNVRSKRTDETWSADWRQAEDSAVRLTVVGGPETEVIACTSPSNTDRDDDVNALIARRSAQRTVFTAVWEPYREKPFLSRIVSLPVKGEGNGSDQAGGVGVEVIGNGSEATECFLASYTPGVKRYGDIELDGKVAAGCWGDSEEEPIYVYMVNGVLLRRNSYSVEASAPASIYVERLAGDRILVKTGDNGAGKMAIEGRLSDEVRVERDGEEVETEVGDAVVFEVAAQASYELSGVLEWERVRLEAQVGAAEADLEERATEPENEAEMPLAEDGPLAGKNKTANGGFEVNYKTHDEVEDPWECWNSYYWAKFRPAYHYDSEVVHSGTYSLKIPRENWANEATRDGWIEQKVSSSGANKTYTLSAWVKSSLDPTRVRLCIYGWNPAWGRDFDGGVSPLFEVGTEWQRISWTRSFGPEIADVYVMVKREHQVLGGDVWIDDVQLEEGGEATAFVPDAWTEAAHLTKK